MTPPPAGSARVEGAAGTRAAAARPSATDARPNGRGAPLGSRTDPDATNGRIAGVVDSKPAVRGGSGGRPRHEPPEEPARNRRLGSVTEKQLIQRLKDGDQRAARTLYEAHVDRIFRLCYRFAGEYDLAQDFTQETFVQAFTRIGTFRGESAFGTWIASIAANVSLNQLRKIRRFRDRETELDERLHVANPARRLEPDLREDLYRAIDALPERARAVFVLHDVEGYTHEEIGAILGIQAGTSKSQLFRARRRLRKDLAVHAGEWAS